MKMLKLNKKKVDELLEQTGVNLRVVRECSAEDIQTFIEFIRCVLVSSSSHIYNNCSLESIAHSC